MNRSIFKGHGSRLISGRRGKFCRDGSVEASESSKRACVSAFVAEQRGLSACQRLGWGWVLEGRVRARQSLLQGLFGVWQRAKKVKCKCKVWADFSPARACLTWTGLLLLLLSSSNAFLHQRQYQRSSISTQDNFILLIIDKTGTPAVLAELGPTEGWDGRKGRPQAKLVPGPGKLQRGPVWTWKGRQVRKGKRQGGLC